MSTANDAIKAAPPQEKRLLNRGLPVTTYHLRAADPDEVAAAEQAVADAKDEAEIASYRTDEAGSARQAAAAEQLAAARARLAACFDPVKIRALAPAEYEALIGQHEDEKQPEGFDRDPVARAAFLAGVQGPYSAQEWDAAILPQCSRGELQEIYLATLIVNARGTGGAIPKG
jgi:hypothetical protein